MAYIEQKIDGGKYRDLAQLSSMKYLSSSPSPPCRPLLPCHFNVFHPRSVSPLTCSFPSPFKYRPSRVLRVDSTGKTSFRITLGKDVQLFKSCDPQNMPVPVTRGISKLILQQSPAKQTHVISIKSVSNK